MSAKSFQRGWPIVFRQQWVYEDSGESIKIERACVRCGKMPTPEGYDACLGKLPNVKGACCGHGILKQAYIIKE